MPVGKWIGIRSEITTDDNGVVIKLYIDRNKDGNWELAAEMRDQGSKYGKMPFWGEGYAGLRSDLMDLEFDNYMINADTLKL